MVLGEVFLEEVPLEVGVTVPCDLEDLEVLLEALGVTLDLDLDPDLCFFVVSSSDDDESESESDDESEGSEECSESLSSPSDGSLS